MEGDSEQAKKRALAKYERSEMVYYLFVRLFENENMNGLWS